MKRAVLIILCFVFLASSSACTINGMDLESFRDSIAARADAKETRSGVEKIVQTSEGTVGLRLEHTAGNIEISESVSKEISVSFEKIVRGNDESANREVMDNIKVLAEKKGNILTVKAVARDDGNTDLWKWVSGKYHNISVSINYTISVPKEIRKYTIGMVAGNVKLQGLAGEMDITSNAGNIEMQGVSPEGRNNIELNAGNITIDCIAIVAADSITTKCNAGNFTMSLPGDSGLDFDLSVNAGNIGGTLVSKQVLGKGKVKDEINGGGTLVKTNLNAGNITVDKK